MNRPICPALGNTRAKTILSGAGAAKALAALESRSAKALAERKPGEPARKEAATTNRIRRIGHIPFCLVRLCPLPSALHVLFCASALCPLPSALHVLPCPLPFASTASRSLGGP